MYGKRNESTVGTTVILQKGFLRNNKTWASSPRMAHIVAVHMASTIVRPPGMRTVGTVEDLVNSV